MAWYTLRHLFKKLMLESSENPKMKRLSIVVVAAAAALFLAACDKTTSSPNSNFNSGSTNASATPDPFATTRATFEKDCKECHGSNGTGGPVKLADGTKLKVPSLREGHALRHPDSDFVKQIEKGGDGMPAFKDKLSAQQITDMISFIRHEFQGGMMPPGAPMMKNMNMK
jgi:mono/diheme cytochrome c family protein